MSRSSNCFSFMLKLEEWPVDVDLESLSFVLFWMPEVKVLITLLLCFLGIYTVVNKKSNPTHSFVHILI